MIRDDEALTYQSTMRGPRKQKKNRWTGDERSRSAPLLACFCSTRPHGRPVPRSREPVWYRVLCGVVPWWRRADTDHRMWRTGWEWDQSTTIPWEHGTGLPFRFGGGRLAPCPRGPPSSSH